MTVDFEFIRWLAGESEDVLNRIAPLVAKIINVEEAKVLDFVKYVAEAADKILDAIEFFVKFPVLFGAPGDGLTNADGKTCPDCPDCNGHEAVVFALKAQTLAA